MRIKMVYKLIEDYLLVCCSTNRRIGQLTVHFVY